MEQDDLSKIFEELQEENKRVRDENKALQQINQELVRQVESFTNENLALAHQLRQKEECLQQNRMEEVEALKSAHEKQIEDLKRQHIREQLKLKARLTILESQADTGRSVALPPQLSRQPGEMTPSKIGCYSPTNGGESVGDESEGNDRGSVFNAEIDLEEDDGSDMRSSRRGQDSVDDDEWKPSTECRRRSTRLLNRVGKRSAGSFAIMKKRPGPKRRKQPSVEELQSILASLKDAKKPMNEEETVVLLKFIEKNLTKEMKRRNYQREWNRARARRNREIRQMQTDNGSNSTSGLAGGSVCALEITVFGRDVADRTEDTVEDANGGIGAASIPSGEEGH